MVKQRVRSDNKNCLEISPKDGDCGNVAPGKTPENATNAGKFLIFQSVWAPNITEEMIVAQ